MGGTETCRRPGLCLTGPVLGPFEPDPPGAPIPGASPLCSSQCSCSKMDRPTKYHYSYTDFGNVFPSVRASKYNSVNRYFKADIRLAKRLKDGKARASMTSRNLAIGYFIGWFIILLFYSVFQRKSFTFNGSHSTLSTFDKSIYIRRRFRSPDSYDYYYCYYFFYYFFYDFRRFFLSILLLFLSLLSSLSSPRDLFKDLILKFPIATPKLTNQIGFKYFSQFLAELVAVINVVSSDCDTNELLIQDFYRKLVLTYPFLLYS